MSRALPALALLLLLASCEAFHSDSENFISQQRAERARRVAGMRAATQQAPAGARVSGETLTSLVSGRTHVFVYGTTPGGRAQRYLEYSFFCPDGHFVYLNSAWAKDSAGRASDRWRVDGDRLCILNGEFSDHEQCYRLAVLPGGRVQYFIAQPGSEADGLLTKVTDEVRVGPPDLAADS